ncbi:bile acid:sodium symporter family protein [Mesorhizobium sp. ANAO-SY3R2]|uniref:bile acid:sodium symporter family protein n=1 Tax=Mesorhizobium sp. ANAO-SY3R2 TaxID=3166644 RepID=UPI003672FD0C
MTLAQLIPFAISASMFMIVLAIGLNATLHDATYLFRNPSLLVRSILSMNVVMLVVAGAIAFLFDPPPAIKIAIVALAVSPVPPILPTRQEKAGGTEEYTIGLLVAAAAIAVVLVPLSVQLLARITGIPMHEPPSKIAAVVFSSVIVPLLSGVAIRHFAPELARRASRPIPLLAAGLLFLACIPVLLVAWPAVRTLLGNGMVIALAAFTFIGLGVGHLLGGPNKHDQAVLALATGTRHPGVALAIANLNFPAEKGALAVVLSHLIIGAIVSVPYVRWRINARSVGTEAK